MGKESACNARNVVWSLGQEDPLKEEMAIHSSILAGIIPWTEESGRLHSIGLQRVGMTEATEHTQTHMHTHGRTKWANIHGARPMGSVLCTLIIFHPAFQLSIFLFTLFWDLNAPPTVLGTIHTEMFNEWMKAGDWNHGKHAHFCSLLYLQHPELCLTHTWCSVYTFWKY